MFYVSTNIEFKRGFDAVRGWVPPVGFRILPCRFKKIMSPDYSSFILVVNNVQIAKNIPTDGSDESLRGALAKVMYACGMTVLKTEDEFANNNDSMDHLVTGEYIHPGGTSYDAYTKFPDFQI